MTSSSINEYVPVVELLKDRKNDLEIFTTYAPSHRFIEAFVSATSLSFSVKDEDGSIFAMAIGELPIILECDRLATSRGLEVDLSLLEHRADWDFYSIDTEEYSNFPECEISMDDEAITNFLKLHAPNSSVWPANPEILFWGAKYATEELVALGALVQWRTGQVMFASIGTHASHRNKGLAQDLVKGMLSRAQSMGVEHVGLGVFAENISAKRAYERVGFNLVNEFSTFNRK